MANEVWRECASWLTRCGVLRPDHKAKWPEADIFDLALTLRDGVLLCNLISSLDPGCIDMKDVNQKPQLAQFLCLRNIKVFLQACHDYYGLPESDLFEPLMLFDFTDFYRVIHTLSKLSNCPKFQKKNIPGFSVHRPRTLSQEDIYRNLNSTLSAELDTNKSGSQKSQNWLQFKIKSPQCEEDEEQIYEFLCCVTFSSEVPTPISHNLEKRDYVINELVETEKNYVDVLGTLQKCFIRPLQNVLKDDDFRVIFWGIKELAEIHGGFLSQLRKATTPNSMIKLSETFLNWREKFLIYGDYCANLTTAQDKIQEICNRSENINQLIQVCQEEANNNKFKLRDILSVPMQRILKYHLLLDKLISETQPNHEDYRGLERAKEAMIDVAQYINEVKKDSDTLQIMADIQASITDWSLAENMELRDFGRLIKDGELRIKAHNDQKVKVRYVFIFDQVILMCKALKGDQYCFKESLMLRDYKIEDAGSKRILHRESRWNYHWFLLRKGERFAYTMYARTEELKKKWIKAIQDAFDNIEPSACRNTDHKFSMHTFERPTTCSHCSKFLKGIIYQGYRCDKCYLAAHKQCISFTGRCGLKPPQLPARHASPLSDPLVAELPQAVPPLPSDWSWSPAQSSDHGLTDYLWFVGSMGRETAERLLEWQMDGTFLLRIRPQGPTHPNETAYALSLKSDNKVKHMKVYEREVDGTVEYYLSESRFFRSLVDLISCYEHTSLGENFIGLNVQLQWPFKRIVAVAEFDFNPVEPNLLPLKQGCQVIVLSKEGDHKGWWKGKVQDRVGFFPKVFVREITDNFNIEMDFHSAN
nr:PREDICTED: protein vav isoform X1 [Bemisia tabaci]